MSVLAGWLEAVESRQPDALAQAFCIDISSEHVFALQKELRKNPGSHSSQVPQSDFPALDALAKSYLNWCADVDPQNGAIRSFDLFAHVLMSLSAAWADPRDGDCLNQTRRRYRGTARPATANRCR